MTICLPARVPLRSTLPRPPPTWTDRLALTGEDSSTRLSRRVPGSFGGGDSTAVSVGFAAASAGGTGTTAGSGLAGIDAVGRSSLTFCSLISSPPPRIRRSYEAPSGLYGLTKDQPDFVATCR